MTRLFGMDSVFSVESLNRGNCCDETWWNRLDFHFLPTAIVSCFGLWLTWTDEFNGVDGIGSFRLLFSNSSASTFSTDFVFRLFQLSWFCWTWLACAFIFMGLPFCFRPESVETFADYLPTVRNFGYSFVVQWSVEPDHCLCFFMLLLPVMDRLEFLRDVHSLNQCSCYAMDFFSA